MTLPKPLLSPHSLFGLVQSEFPERDIFREGRFSP